MVSLYQMKKEKYSSELLSRYMTDSLADETEGEGNRKSKKEHCYSEGD